MMMKSEAPRRKAASPAGANDPRDNGRASVACPSPDETSASTSAPAKIRRRRWSTQLAPPALLAAGVTVFTRSFFLSRTSFDERSPCVAGSAGDLLRGALGMGEGRVGFLRRRGFLSDRAGGGGGGCWVPRRVDSAAILVIDALRFDFARDHLPLSVGSRLFPPRNGTHGGENIGTGTSKLYQFVADPPTVTMQRLKGITTGGLPTFADISGSFGGASVDEDSWVEQLKEVPWDRRRNSQYASNGEKEKDSERGASKPRIAFVGDDTWVDLFPTQFDDCHPFPSFNTRDLDTVDNGCLEHLPRLLDGMLGLEVGNEKSSPFELIVVHTLGVDHVGHTYGPNNPHMEGKLHQMDVMLSGVLDAIDRAPKSSCVAALVLGDHGMTEDGNHGGGTEEEVNAGLFVHFSPGCGNGNEDGRVVTGDEVPGSARAFDSIHQIDLVPTISFMLGLPVPYANIGGLVPDLLPAPRSGGDPQSATAHATTALALNAAQVWNYLDTYSKQSRDLPVDRLRELKELLDGAVVAFESAIAQSEGQSEDPSVFDSSSYRQASALFKIFLAESTGLGKQVWTQFDEGGMMIGIWILAAAWILTAPFWKGRTIDRPNDRIIRSSTAADANRAMKGDRSSENVADGSFCWIEMAAATIFMIFQCGVLTFGNSYIEHEREIVTFFLSMMCLIVFRRWCYLPAMTTSAGRGFAFLPLIVALCSRIGDVFVSGHGLDPSIRLHPAHHPVVFLSSLSALVILRLRWFGMSKSINSSNRSSIPFSSLIDVGALIFLAMGWLEKRSPDPLRNGHTMARSAMIAVFVGLVHSMSTLNRRQKLSSRGGLVEWAQLALFRALQFLMVVTGPSTASTAVLIVIQVAALRLMTETNGTKYVPAPVMAALWRLAVRHVFFATNHHCSFNRLQYSAAFVATDTFQFYLAGSSLFMNTFGWEFLGSCLVLLYSQLGRTGSGVGRDVWDWFRFFQWTEMLACCLSVSVMKRHLMVWAIFAPRFMFAATFTAVSFTLGVFNILMANSLFSQAASSPLKST